MAVFSEAASNLSHQPFLGDDAGRNGISGGA